MIQENEIRAQILEYLSHNRSLDEFEDWLVQQSWNMHRDSDLFSQRLVGRIELALAEYDEGHLSESALRKRLVREASTYKVVFGTAATNAQIVDARSSSVTIQRQFFGMQPAMECGS